MKIKAAVFIIFIICSLYITAFSKLSVDDPIWHGNRLEKTIAITFDDGPNTITTPEILEILDDNDAVGTFCLSGEHAKKDPGLVREIAKRGNELCNHAQTHPWLSDCTAKKQAEEILACSKTLQEITGKKVTLFRPPYLNHNTKTLEIARDAGMKVVLGDIDSEDYSDLSESEIIHKCLTEAQNGSIIIFHDSVHDGGPRPKTAKILPKIIFELQLRGFKLVSVSELLASR